MNVHLKEWALTPKPGFIYRTIGGILDMYFFLGPTPSESASQYAQAVGEWYQDLIDGSQVEHIVLPVYVNYFFIQLQLHRVLGLKSAYIMVG